jgi:hypothetical protein
LFFSVSFGPLQEVAIFRHERAQFVRSATLRERLERAHKTPPTLFAHGLAMAAQRVRGKQDGDVGLLA